MKAKPFLLVIVALLASGRCAAANSTPATAAEPAPAAESFELRPGEKATVADGELVVSFVGVLEDSRCPKGEQCIQAGRVRLSFEATRRGGQPVRFVLDSSRESDAGVEGFQIDLVSVQPVRIAAGPISPGDYVAKVSIRPL